MLVLSSRKFYVSLLCCIFVPFWLVCAEHVTTPLVDQKEEKHIMLNQEMQNGSQSLTNKEEMEVLISDMLKELMTLESILNRAVEDRNALSAENQRLVIELERLQKKQWTKTQFISFVSGCLLTGLAVGVIVGAFAFD